MTQPHLEKPGLTYSEINLTPPFKAGSETINCPLPMVKRFNPVTVHDWCHGWTNKNILCHYAADCHAYLDLLIRKVNEGAKVNVQTLEKLGIDCEILKRARRR